MFRATCRQSAIWWICSTGIPTEIPAATTIEHASVRAQACPGGIDRHSTPLVVPLTRENERSMLWPPTLYGLMIVPDGSLLKLRLIRVPAVKLLFFTSIGTENGPPVLPETVM